MILDAHTHAVIGTDPEAARHLVESMQKAGIDKALVIGGAVPQSPQKDLIKAIAPYADRLFAVGSISPLKEPLPAPSEIDQLFAEGKLHGLKFYTGYEHFYPSDPRLVPYLDVLVKYNRPAIFHSGDTWSERGGAKLKYAMPIHIDDLATDMPSLKIVIAHLGYPWVIDAAEVMYKNKNVYADCSGFVYGEFTAEHEANFTHYVKEFIRVVGTTERIMFGTDWPISDQSSYVRVVQKVFASAPGVMGETAARLFGIDR
jgi:predicted TIM-barrel fold metal-dependent hydrolase